MDEHAEGVLYFDEKIVQLTSRNTNRQHVMKKAVAVRKRAITFLVRAVEIYVLYDINYSNSTCILKDPNLNDNSS